MLSFFKSFKYALRGFLFCLRNERNMRIHCVAAVYVLLFSFFYELSRMQYCILLLTLALVMGMEMVNTSVEEVINLVAPHYDQMARIAKDVAAGAVLVCALAAVGVGVALFWDVEVFARIAAFFLGRPVWLVLLALSLISALCYIILGPYRILHLSEKTVKRKSR